MLPPGRDLFSSLLSAGAGLILDGRYLLQEFHFMGEMGDVYVPVPWEELDYYKENQVFMPAGRPCWGNVSLYRGLPVLSCMEIFLTDGMAERLEQ